MKDEEGQERESGGNEIFCKKKNLSIEIQVLYF